MGAGKRQAIHALLAASGHQPTTEQVDAAFLDFRERLDRAYLDVPPQPFPGVVEALTLLKRRGILIALATGFDRDVTDAILAGLGWGPTLVDTTVCIEDVTLGRPASYLIFHAMETLGVSAPPARSSPATPHATSKPGATPEQEPSSAY